MAEAKITKQVKKLLDKFIHEGENLYYNKISDRFTSGIPDIQGTFNSVSFYIELKDVGKVARKLQLWHLRAAKKSGAAVISSDNYDEVEAFLMKLKNFEVPSNTLHLLADASTL